MTNVLIFGDSIAYGDYDLQGGWATRLKVYCAKKAITQKLKKDINVFIQANPWGDTSQEVLEKLDVEVKPRVWSNHEAIFIFAFGINDAILIAGKSKVTLSKFKSNLNEIVNIAKKYSNKMIFLGPTHVDEIKVTPMPWSPTEYWYNNRIKKYNQFLKDFCSKNNLDFIDFFNRFNKMNYKHLLFDGAHPNTKGHELIFKTVKNFLEEKKYI